ncbi:MAG TPA: ABC-F family ATP-binding cassette domain-containing protein [Clostridiaceae bacterium]
MLLIEVNNLIKNYGDRLILDIKALKVNSEDKIGIVGLNGSGKTTLIDILRGKVKEDSGEVRIHCNYAYISQLEKAEPENLDKAIARRYRIEELWKDTFSGGEKTRFKIGSCMSKDSPLIFADEPTSNLDIASREALQKSFKEFKGAIMLISHDRRFLDSICNKILHIELGKVQLYDGNYTEYSLLRKEEEERNIFLYNSYQREKKKLQGAIDDTKDKVKSIRKTPKRMGNSEARLHKMGGQNAQAKLSSSVDNLKKRLARLEVMEKLREMDKIKIDINIGSHLYSKELIKGGNINLSFQDKKVFERAEFTIYNGSKTALLGANGSGKSSLIKMIMEKNSNIKTCSGLKIGYFSQSLDILEEELSIFDNVFQAGLDETLVRTVLSRLLFKKEEVYKKVKFLSGGEKVKASLAKILLKDNNMLILDEVTNYLDIYSMEAVQWLLKEFDRTILFVSHDREFISAVANSFLEIKDKKLIYYKGTYKDYIEDGFKNNRDNIALLENRLALLVGKLSMPTKKDNIEELNKEYYRILGEIKAKGGNI